MCPTRVTIKSTGMRMANHLFLRQKYILYSIVVGVVAAVVVVVVGGRKNKMENARTESTRLHCIQRTMKMRWKLECATHTDNSVSRAFGCIGISRINNFKYIHVWCILHWHIGTSSICGIGW